MAGLILDTGVLIAWAHGDYQSHLDRDDNFLIPAIAVAEFRAGLELDANRPRAEYQRRWIEAVLAIVPIAVYDEHVAAAHATLLAHTQRTGTMRGAHDLIVAATALATDRTIATTDGTARFDQLPGVNALVLS